MQIYPHHLRSLPTPEGTGLCASGCRDWFTAHGLSWAEFVEHGTPEARLAATGDALALAVIAHARATATSAQDH